ncbi:MAG: hypothetical protein AAF919_04645 [Pseudomonadota bacterium]
MTVLRQTILALVLTVPVANATPSGVVETFATCVGRLDAAYAPADERRAMLAMLTDALPAALDWGMPESHVAQVRRRAHLVQMELQNDALFGRDPRIKEAAARSAKANLESCRALLMSASKT